MISSAGMLYAKRAGHNGKTVARKEANVNGKDLPPRIPLDPRFMGMKNYTANTIYFTSLQSTGTQDTIVDDFRRR